LRGFRLRFSLRWTEIFRASRED